MNITNPNESFIFLRIVGFTIRLILKPTEYQKAKKLFLLQLHKEYSGFTIKSFSGEPDFTIQVEYNLHYEIIKEKRLNFISYYRLGFNKKRVITFYTTSLEQLTLLIRYILYRLLEKSGFFMHGSVGIYNDKAMLFIGPSGRGKSTILRILRKDIMPFADDAFAIRRIGGNYYCFQTPSLDKQIWIKKSFQKYPIRALFLLRQSKKTYLNQAGTINSKVSLLEEVVSNASSNISFTKQFLSFIQSHPSLYTFFFNRNRQQIFEAIKNIDKSSIERTAN